MIARIVRTSVPARPIVAQIAQNPPEGWAGFFCTGEPAEPSPSSPACADTIGLSPILLKWTWPKAT